MYQYIVYKVTNVVNNKIYIGKHKTKNINDNYLGSGKHLRRSIQKYGKDKFVKEILYIFESEDEMNKMETEIVTEEFVSRKDVYNIAIGGQGGGMGGANHGPNHPATIGNNEFFKNISDISRRNFKESMKNEAYKNEFINLIKDGLNIFYTNGGQSGFKNKKHTEEFKKKLGRVNSIKQKGNKNSQYGTIWIYNLELKINKKIKNEELENYITLGWTKGRKMSF